MVYDTYCFALHGGHQSQTQAQSNLNDLQGHIKTLKISFRNSSDKNETSVIIYAFSCKSKPV